jgi:hypothetical protein
MKIITNLSEYSEFKIDEGALKSAIVKCFSNIKKPLYIHINKNLIRCHGLHRRDWITELKKYPTSWPSQFISEIKNSHDLYHRITLSYEFMHNAFHNRKESNLDTETWYIRKYFDFDPKDYPYIYLFFLLAHELQHAQQCDSLRMKYFKYDSCHVQYKKKNWREYEDVDGNADVLEFDAEIASINKTLKLYESYF